MIQTLSKRLVAVLWSLIFLLLLPFVALGCAIIFVNGSVLGLVERARWLRGLRRDGRVIAAAELLTTAQGGTLIVDRPGFKVSPTDTHCWWTNENVPELSPVSIPTDDERMELLKGTNEMTVHEFDDWCWRRYLAPDGGTAALVTPPHHGAAMASKLREHLPNLVVVNLWSAPVVRKQTELEDAT